MQEDTPAAQSWSITALAISDGPLPPPVAASSLRKIVLRKQRLRRQQTGDLMATQPEETHVRLFRNQMIARRLPMDRTPSEQQSAMRLPEPARQSPGNYHRPVNGHLSTPDPLQDLAFAALGPLFASAQSLATIPSTVAGTEPTQTPIEVPDPAGKCRCPNGAASGGWFSPTQLQAEDLARVLGRRYAYLAWQQGSGKTLAGYLWSRAKSGALARTAQHPFGHARLVVVLAPALAAEETWVPFLSAQGVPFTLARRRADVLDVDVRPRRERTGTGLRREEVHPLQRETPVHTLVVPTSMVDALKRPLARLIRRASRNVALVVDEADELASYDSLRTQAALAVFRRCRYKLLMTGTVTRNHNRYPLCHHGIAFSAAEAALHERITKEFQALMSSYFTSTGSARKDAGLRAVRQLRLLIDSCSHPTLFPDYAGTPCEVSRKMRRVLELAGSFSDELVSIGIRRREAFSTNLLERWVHQLGKPGRTVFQIDGTLSPAQRGRVLADFEASGNGILACTQQSLSSSLNAPRCNRVIIPALAWNMPSVQQHFFRFIRFDMEKHTEVHFVTYERSIETNLLALNINKERLNLIVRDGEAPSTDVLVEELGFDPSLMVALMEKHRDIKGNVHIRWTQSVHTEGESVQVGA